MTSRERFEAKFGKEPEGMSTEESMTKHALWCIARDAWAESERQALERAAEICDEAWKFEQDAGIAANAIRALTDSPS